MMRKQEVCVKIRILVFLWINWIMLEIMLIEQLENIVNG